MSRINTNVQSLIAQRVLGQNNTGLNSSLERLSTGLRINRGKDDPAGLIASENMRSELASLNSAVKNGERADQVMNIAEGGLQEISSMLVELQGLLNASASQAGLSDSEREANQLQIDSILQTIDRVAGSTSFQGTKLLNGNFDYQVTGVNAGVSDFSVRGAKFTGSSQTVSAIVTGSARRGEMMLVLSGGSLNLSAAGNSFVIEIAGSKGSRELSFSSGQSTASIAAAINALTEVTGVSAVVPTGSTSFIRLRSAEFGSDEFVSLKVLNDGGATSSGTAANTGIYAVSADGNLGAELGELNAATNGFRKSGQDIQGTINGIIATGKGRTMSVNTDFLDMEMTLAAASAAAVSSRVAFTITGGGADFQLGSDVNVANKVSIGIKNVAARNLGRVEESASQAYTLADLASGKALNVVDGDKLGLAQKAVANAIEQVSTLRGRIGAFQKNVIGSTVRSLGVAIENTSAAESAVRDADFAKETAQMTRNQILVSAATNTLALANQNPQSALQLLG